MSAPWQFDPAVDPGAFAALDYAAASAGIARTQRENRDGWYAHARRNRSFILDAAARVARPHLAVVLGAGKAYDLPLAELAARFERVVLVDIDAAALAAASAATVPDAALRERLELKALDLTGVTSRLAREIQLKSTADETLEAFEQLCRSYRLDAPPRWLAEPADLIVSSMVLSQLGLQPKLTAKRRFEERFGRISESQWSAWNDLEFSLQRDHIDALAAHAELAVLSSDVMHHSGGESWSVVGASRLEQRIPAYLEIVKQAAWTWDRVHGEVKTDVGALVLRRRP